MSFLDNRTNDQMWMPCAECGERVEIDKENQARMKGVHGFRPASVKVFCIGKNCVDEYLRKEKENE